MYVYIHVTFVYIYINIFLSGAGEENFKQTLTTHRIIENAKSKICRACPWAGDPETELILQCKSEGCLLQSSRLLREG